MNNETTETVDKEAGTDEINKENNITDTNHKNLAKEDSTLADIIIPRRSILREFDPLYSSPVIVPSSKLDKLKLEDQPMVLEEVAEEEFVPLQKLLEEEKREKLLKKLRESESAVRDYKLLLEKYKKFDLEKQKELEQMELDCKVEKQHLSDYETSFSELISKYEKCKPIIKELKNYEESLKAEITTNKIALQKTEEEYKKFEAVSTMNIESCKKEIDLQKAKYEQEIGKLLAVKKMGDIKISSTTTSLELLTRECEKMKELFEN